MSINNFPKLKEQDDRLKEKRTDLPTTTVHLPWMVSSTKCKWWYLPGNMKSRLRPEHGYQATLGEFHYQVKKTKDDSYIVYRETKAEHEEAIEIAAAETNQKRFYKKSDKVTEIQAVPVEEANKLLLADKDYNVIGSDPVKVLDGKFFVILCKSESQDSNG
jgi:hypothetical protein